MSLQGLPDFQQPLRFGDSQVFFPYGGSGPHLLAPDGLEVATRDDGSPDFSLELVRGQNPLLPPTPYGVLDFRIRQRYRTGEALSFLRGSRPGAMVAHPALVSGFLRFNPLADTDFPVELLKPAPLAWNGLGVARTIIKLSRDAVTVLKEALEAETLTLQASAELEMVGVSPRLPLRVRFNPARFLAALAALGDAERRVTRAAVVKLFQKDWGLLPCEVLGKTEGVSQVEFAEAMADRVRVRFGQFVPSPAAVAEPSFALPKPEAVGGGSFEWDLKDALQTPRAFVLELHPMEAARELVKERGIDAVYRETVVPPIPTGFHTVSLSANLPAERPGVESLGVTLSLPPRPPQRFQAVEATVEFVPPEDRGSTLLKLAPTEKLEYTYRTFAVVSNSRGGEQYEGAARRQAGDRLDLGPADFPVNFVSVEAAPALLELAALGGVCRWRDAAGTVEQPFELTPGRAAIALAVPSNAEDAALEIEARAPEGASLKLGPFPAGDTRLDLHSFSEYGPHSVEIKCAFGAGAKSFAVDLLAEGLDETPQEINVLHFTPDKPVKTWTYFAGSPFRPGFKYRPHRDPRQPAAAWSVVRSPVERLAVGPGALAGGKP